MAHSLGVQPIMDWEIKAVGTRDSSSLCICGQEKENDECPYPVHFLHFIPQPGMLSQGIVPPRVSRSPHHRYSNQGNALPVHPGVSISPQADN